MKCLIFIVFALVLTMAGCHRSGRVLEIRGKVMDDRTKALIPGRKVIIQALVTSDKGTENVNAGQTYTDSSGYFFCALQLVENARYYDFCFVGDSVYAYRSRKLGLMEMKYNPRFLAFELSKLADLTINVRRKTRIPATDTISLSWVSDGVEGRVLSSYRIKNFGRAPDKDLWWFGGNVISTIETKVFADKRTKIYWSLLRNGKRSEIIDTITCRRDTKNVVYFSY